MSGLFVLPDARCQNERHRKPAPAAWSRITLAFVPADKGWNLCDDCLLEYVDQTYASGARVPFSVQPL